MRFHRRALIQVVLALVMVSMATMIRWILEPWLGDRGPFLTYFAAVGLASWMGGLLPGMVALIAGGLLADYYFLPPRYQLGISRVENQIGYFMFYFVGLMLVGMAELQQRARRRAEGLAREAIEQKELLEAEILRRQGVERDRESLIRQQEELRAIAETQSATLATLVNQVPIGIALFDENLRTFKVNTPLASLLELEPSEVLARTLTEILLRINPQAHQTEIETVFRRVLETGEPYTAIWWPDPQSIGNEPATRHINWSLRRIERTGGGPLSVLGTFIDVTEEVKKTHALHRSEQLFRLAADAVDGLIYDVDISTGHVNRTLGMFKLLGYQPDEVPPTVDWWFQQIHPDDATKLREKHSKLRNGDGRTMTEYRVRHRDGHYVHVVDRSIASVAEDGDIVRYVGCTQDLSEIRQAEEALREADRRKDEFLAVLAHEIRNPLASIRNALRLMKRTERRALLETEVEELERDRAMAERQVTHLSRLFDDLMDVSRIARGLITLQVDPIDLAEPLHRAVEATRLPLEERGHRLTWHHPDQPLPVRGDSTRLEQVFGNLLSNAIKYTTPGGQITVETVIEATEAVVRVRDSGLGIDVEMLPRVFDMFVQDKRHLGHSQGGLGIGLALSRSLVELHGGRIEARSDGLGMGSAFEVRLPLNTQAAEPRIEPSASHPAQACESASPQPRRVLVVDDNEDIAASLARLLKRIYRHEVRVAHDGPSALRTADEFEPEIVLLDIGLPGMDGCEVARRLRDEPRFQAILLIALTGWGQESDRQRSEAAGIDHHLVKPVDPDALASLMTRAVR